MPVLALGPTLALTPETPEWPHVTPPRTGPWSSESPPRAFLREPPRVPPQAAHRLASRRADASAPRRGQSCPGPTHQQTKPPLSSPDPSVSPTRRNLRESNYLSTIRTVNTTGTTQRKNTCSRQVDLVVVTVRDCAPAATTARDALSHGWCRTGLAHCGQLPASSPIATPKRDPYSEQTPLPGRNSSERMPGRSDRYRNRGHRAHHRVHRHPDPARP